MLTNALAYPARRTLTRTRPQSNSIPTLCSKTVKTFRSHTTTWTTAPSKATHQLPLSSFQSTTTPLTTPHSQSSMSSLYVSFDNNTLLRQLTTTSQGLMIDMKHTSRQIHATLLTFLHPALPPHSTNRIQSNSKTLSRSILSAMQRPPRGQHVHTLNESFLLHTSPLNKPSFTSLTTSTRPIPLPTPLNPYRFYSHPPAFLLGWSLFGWGEGQQQPNAAPNHNPGMVPNFGNSNDPEKPFIAVPLRKVIKFEKSDPSEKLPPPPTRSKNQLDEYGISIHNVFRYCNEERTHQKFKVNYVEGDVHHNINDYRTFIEKERFYIQKDYNELLLHQNVYIRRLLQLHYILGLRLDREKEYKEAYKAKVIEDLLLKKKRLLDAKMKEAPEDQREEVYQQYHIKLTQDEIDAIDLDLFGDIRQSNLLPFHLRGGFIQNDPAPPPPDPAGHEINLDETSAELLSEVLFPPTASEFDRLNEAIGVSKAITSPKPKIFHQPTHGDLDLLPPHLLSWLERIRGSVLFSMKSAEELTQAMHSLNGTLSAFDTMVQDSLDIEDYKQEMNILACQAAFITGTRQVLHNILRHSDESLYKYEQFYTPSVLRYLASLTFQPELHTNPDQITPYHPDYYDEFTPKGVVEQIKLKKMVTAETSRQDFITQHTNRLIHKNQAGSSSTSSTSAAAPTFPTVSPALQKAHGDIFLTEEDYKEINGQFQHPAATGQSPTNAQLNQLDPKNNNDGSGTDAESQFPIPPLLAIEEQKVNAAVQSFATDITADYAPISYPYKAIKHKWTDRVDKDDVSHQINTRFVLPARTIPPPRDYIPRPAELPVMSGIESNIPEKYRDSPFYGWKEDIMAYKQRVNEDKLKKLAEEGSELQRTTGYQAQKYEERLAQAVATIETPDGRDDASREIYHEFEKSRTFPYGSDGNDVNNINYNYNYNNTGRGYSNTNISRNNTNNNINNNPPVPYNAQQQQQQQQRGGNGYDDDDDDDDDDNEAVLFNNPRRSRDFTPPVPPLPSSQQQQQQQRW